MSPSSHQTNMLQVEPGRQGGAGLGRRGGANGRSGAEARGGAMLQGRLTLPSSDAHQDVSHNYGASVSYAGAVRTDRGAPWRFAGRSRGPVPSCTSNARVSPPRLRSHLLRVAPPHLVPGCSCSDNRGPAGPWRASLGSVHFFQQAEDASGPRGDSVVGPAEVLVVLASLCVAAAPGQGRAGERPSRPFWAVPRWGRPESERVLRSGVGEVQGINREEAN